MLQWILGITALSISVGCLVETRRLANRLKRYIQSHRGASIDNRQLPKALVIIPCKGLQEELPDLENNLRAVLDQDYPIFRVIFAIGDPNDLAAPIIKKLCSEHKHASLVITEHQAGQSQKVSNQLRALQELQPTDQAIAFFDSDARPNSDTLKQLISPLEDRKVGATTGFRWYTPNKGGFGSWLRAAWNAGGMPFMIEHRLNYAWGGAMAIRTEVFKQCKVADYWSHALSDDLGLSLVVKQAGYKIHFVPDCLVHSPEDLTLINTIEWTTRQTVICRVYNLQMWRHIFGGELLTALAIISGLIATMLGMNEENLWVMILGIASPLIVITSRMLYQAKIVRLAHLLSPSLAIRHSMFFLLILAPLVSPLMLFNSIRSWLSRRIIWRGIKYNLISAQKIEIM